MGASCSRETYYDFFDCSQSVSSSTSADTAPLSYPQAKTGFISVDLSTSLNNNIEAFEVSEHLEKESLRTLHLENHLEEFVVDKSMDVNSLKFTFCTN